MRAPLYEWNTDAGLALFGQTQCHAGTGPGHSHLALHGLVVVVAVDVAAQGDCLTEFSIVENLVADADLHACSAPPAGMADRVSDSKLTGGECDRKGI